MLSVLRPNRSRYTVLIDLSMVGVVLLVFLAVRATWWEPVYIPSRSMEPTLHVGDRVWINKRAYAHQQPRAGDVIVFHDPRHPEELLIKRVVAGPGAEVVIHRGVLIVDGKMVVEKYLKDGMQPRRVSPQWHVPDGYVFVLGDNREHSEDSRDFGPVPISSIVGRATSIFLPRDHAGRIRNPWDAGVAAAAE